MTSWDGMLFGMLCGGCGAIAYAIGDTLISWWRHRP